MDKRVCVKWTKVFSWIHLIIHRTQIRAHVESVGDSPHCVWKSSTCKKKFLVTEAKNMQEEKKPHYQQRSVSFTVSYLQSAPHQQFFIPSPSLASFSVFPTFSLLRCPNSSCCFPQTISCFPFLLISLKGHFNRSITGWNRLRSVHTSSLPSRLSSLG